MKSKQEAIDCRYMRMAIIWAENSYAVRRQVGCLIVKDNSIISDGYNGTPSGFPNVCEYLKDNPEKQLTLKEVQRHFPRELATYPYVLHAESNAITKLAKSGNSSVGATIYVTDEPCLECAKLIIQSGIKRVVYHKEYRIHDGLELLIKAGIEVDRLTDEQVHEIPF